MPSPTSPRSITDPERIRALAHPVRLDLLDILAEVGEATATECASRIGESVASCSFHLRMLAKYGYIEPAGRRGREKPWRLVSPSREVRPSPEVGGSLRAVTDLAGLTVLREAERLRHFFAVAERESDVWLQASTLSTCTVWLTLEETADLSRRLQQLTDQFADRSHDPASRPDGARRVHVFGAVHPEQRPHPAGSP